VTIAVSGLAAGVRCNGRPTREGSVGGALDQLITGKLLQGLRK